MTSNAITQQQSGTAKRDARGWVHFLVALSLIGCFFLLNAKRIATDGMTTYDEATHLHEGGEVRDILADGSFADLANYFLAKKVMKGVLYRVWYGVGFLVLPFGVDSGRVSALFASCLALLALFFLAGRLAPEGTEARTGVIAVAIACLAPILHVHGRTAMVEPINLAALLMALLLVVRDRQLETRSSAVLAALGLLLAFLTKYNHALILLFAVTLDAALEARHTRRFRPFLPLVLAITPFVAFLADPARLKGFAYYVWTIPGGQNPIDPTGWLYFQTLLWRITPNLLGPFACVLLAVFAVSRSSRPGVRLVALHFVIGVALAQCNDLKLERILVPLLGSLFALTAVGGVLAAAAFRTEPARWKRSFCALAIVPFLAFPNRELYAMAPDPLRRFETWMDEGIAFSAEHRRALWLGGKFDERVIWNSATLRNRARETDRLERGLPLDFGGAEFFQKSKIDPEAIRSKELDPALLDSVLRTYRSLVVVLDPDPKRPHIDDRYVHQIWMRIRESGQFIEARQPLEAVIERLPGLPERVRMEFWMRRTTR